MQKSIFFRHIVLLISLFITLQNPVIAAEPSPEEKQKQQDAFFLAEKAYIYGYPLVLMEITKQLLTNFPSAGENGAPVNQFMHKTRFPDSSFTELVRPNADTLYSSAFLDLSKEPIILQVPNTQGRYFLMPILDAWTNVFESPGTRTTGSKEGNFVITGPNWQGELPSGLKEIKSPTNMAWIIGRTETRNPDDYRLVTELQKQYTLTPLSAYERPYQPPSNVPTDPNIDMKTPPVLQVENMSLPAFFTKLGELMKENPPAEADEQVVKKFAQIGILPGEKFNVKGMSPEVLKEIEKGADLALRKIKEPPTGGKIINGWKIMASGAIGTYGADYLQRARIAYMGLGANLPKDAVYPTTDVDHTGRLLNGKNIYVMHFTKEQIPPVKGFWSLTLYDERQLFSANRLNRYALGNRNPLKFNPDGSLDIYIQHQSPGPEKESNWLPAPLGKFSLTMRLYWPESSVLNDRWAPPPVRRLN